MKVGIIGSGGREHAICQSLKISNKFTEIFEVEVKHYKVREAKKEEFFKENPNF